MKKKRVALLMCFVLVLGCLTGCKKNEEYAIGGRSININTIAQTFTTKNVRFYDFYTEKVVHLADKKYQVVGSLGGKTISFHDEEGNAYMCAVSEILSDLPSSFLLYQNYRRTIGEEYKKK